MGVTTKQFVPTYKPVRPAASGASSVLGSVRSARTLASRETSSMNTLRMNKEKLTETKNKNFMDQAIKIHNKKLDIVSRTNKDRATYGEAPLPLPTFRDTLREEFGIGNEGQAPASASNMMAQPSQNQGGGVGGLLNVLRNSAIGNIPQANRGPAAKMNIDRNELAQIIGRIPTPKNMVHPMLPKLDELISALDDYDNPKDAIQELMSMDDALTSQGLDLAQYGEDSESFFDAFRNKFGEQAAQTLMENLGNKRGAGR